MGEYNFGELTFINSYNAYVRCESLVISKIGQDDKPAIRYFTARTKFDNYLIT